MRILWVKSGPLLPLDSGGKKRTHAMLTEISKLHDVTYVALLAGGQSLHPDEESDPYAAQKVWIPWKETPKRSIQFPFALLRNQLFSTFPYALEKYISGALVGWLSENSRAERFDLVVCDFLIPAPNFRSLKLAVPSVLFQHNIEAMIWKRLAASSSNVVAKTYLQGQFKRFAKWEKSLSEMFDGVITVSAEDSEYAEKDYGLGNVLGHVPTGVDVDFFAPRKVIGDDADKIIGFLGSMDWLANIQAVEYFVENVYPLIKKRYSDVRFKVIGRNPPPAILQLAMADSSIEVTGSVDDVRPHLKACDLMVVPLLSGGGTRIKILEAMAMGVPVVSTEIGAEGLGLKDGEHLLIADDAQKLADACCDLLDFSGKRRSLADLAYKKLVADNGWDKVVEIFLSLSAQVAKK